MQTVGNTPLVELRNLAPAGTRLFAKLEWYNPTGSVKDRAASFMYEDAVRTGKLRPGQAMVEATSGNTGIGLARIAIVNGHQMVICLPARATEERKQVLRAYGAALVEVDGGPSDAIAKAEEITVEPNEITGELRMFQSYSGLSDKDFAERFDRNALVERIYMSNLHNKVLGKVIDEAEVTEKTAK